MSSRFFARYAQYYNTNNNTGKSVTLQLPQGRQYLVICANHSYSRPTDSCMDLFGGWNNDSFQGCSHHELAKSGNSTFTRTYGTPAAGKNVYMTITYQWNGSVANAAIRVFAMCID